MTAEMLCTPSRSCTACRLGTVLREDGSLYRTNVVPGEGPLPAPIMLIGEAPGQQEDLQGRVFSPTAPAGKTLRQAVVRAGLNWSDLRVTNLLHCRPLDNKIANFPDCVEICKSLYLTPEIEVCAPRVIVVLGAYPAGPYFGGLRATEQAGVVRALSPDRLVVGAIHPSYIARGNWPLMERLLIDPLRLAKELAG